MKRQLFVSSLLAATAASLSAQAVVSPSHFANAEGPSRQSDVVGRSTVPWRFLQVHDDMQGQAMTIRKIAFRRDAVQHASRGTAAFSFICDVYMSTATTTSTTLDTTFDNNHGMDRVRAANLQIVQVPALDPAVPADPEDIEITLNTPFVFAGAGPLAWEIQVISTTTSATVWVDAITGPASTNPRPAARQFGTGCIITGARSPALLSGSSSPNWPAGTMSYNYTGQRLPASGLVSVNFGFTSSSLGGVPLPFLLPGTDQDPSGGCMIYTDAIVTLPALTTSTGIVRSNIGFTPLAALNGIDLYAQVIAPDAMANRFCLVTSNAMQFQLIAPYAAAPTGYLNLTSLGAVAPRANLGGVITKFMP